jgi:hypothetical protein
MNPAPAPQPHAVSSFMKSLITMDIYGYVMPNMGRRRRKG